MGLFSYDIANMNDLFGHQLQDMYYAEHKITKALPKMIEKTSMPALKQALQNHLRETEGQIERLKQVFRQHGQEPKSVDCPAIDGIIEEADDISSEVADKNVLDAALVASAQAIEHYEISRYGTLAAWADQLGRPDCAELLRQNLQEEKAADKKLSQLAEQAVNQRAA